MTTIAEALKALKEENNLSSAEENSVEDEFNYYVNIELDVVISGGDDYRINYECIFDECIADFKTLKEAKEYLKSDDYDNKINKIIDDSGEDGEWDDEEGVFRSYREWANEFGFKVIVTIEDEYGETVFTDEYYS